MSNKSTPSSIAVYTPKNTKNYNAALEKSMNYIGKQIAQARNKSGLSLVKFSTVLKDYGVSATASAIQKWENGSNTPNPYQLVAIAQALQMDCDLSLFMSSGPAPELNDEGMRKVADYKADLIASGRYKPESRSSRIIQFVEMPVSNLSVSAGTGAFLDEGSFEMVSFPVSSVPDGADFGVRVSGDSMEPVYHDGQIVWVKRCDRVNVGEVGIFIYDGEGYIKVYDEQEPDEEQREAFSDSYGTMYMQPVMISYNQKYAPRVISPQAGFQVVGHVLK